MNAEIELKLRIRPQDIGRLETYDIFRKYNNGTLERHLLISTYFDTRMLDFIRNKVALRVRQKDQQIIQTLKFDSRSEQGLSRRPEVEWLLSAPVVDLTLAHKYLPTALQSFGSTDLKPVFETRIHRTRILLDWPASVPTTIEVAIDQGEVCAGQHKEAVSEIELELISGDEDSLHQLHQELQQDFELEPCDISKAALGYQLAKLADKP
ncbi:CYTH domain-containing protein [Endozoicomonadaceae bacterium StTr2]